MQVSLMSPSAVMGIWNVCPAIVDNSLHNPYNVTEFYQWAFCDLHHLFKRGKH